MKWIRKSLGLLLTLCIVLSLAGTAFAASPTRHEQTVVNPHYADRVTVYEIDAACEAIRAESPAQTLATPSYSSIAKAAQYMRQQMVGRVEEITFRLTTKSRQDFYATVDALLEKALAHTGVANEGDYLDYQYGGYYVSADTNNDYELVYTWTIPYYTTASQEKSVTNKLNSIMPSIRAAKGDYGRLKAIYDYICSNVVYDYDHLSDRDYQLQYTAYAALIQGTSVCQGYANLFYRMALEAGVDARIISSQELDHSWNIARIGSEYYYNDSTWDAGESSYGYFLRGRSDFYDHGNSDDQFSSSSYAKQYPLASTRYIPGDPVSITSQPQNYTGKVGATAKFTVAARGSGLTYQWQYSDDGGSTWTNSSSTGTSATCSITAARDGRLYRCIVTDGSGNRAVSNSARVIIQKPPSITTQPKNFTGKVGETATFTVKATGTKLTYQWQYSSDGGKTWTNSSSTTATASCEITPGRDGRLYRCIVKDNLGSKTTSASAKITVQRTKLKITSQPQNCTNKVGQTATFTVKAVGDGLKYQWQYSSDGGKTWKDSSSTTAKATCAITAARDGRLYRCVVRDGYGNKVTSDRARLIVGTPLKITTQPQSVKGKVGSTVTFTVKATGDGLKYQWQYSSDGGKTWKASNSTTAKASCSITAARDGRLYRCIVSDKYGNSVTSSKAKLTVQKTTLKITTQPKNYTNKVGQTATFTVKAAGDELKYQWQYSDNSGSTWKTSKSTTAKATCEITKDRNGRLYRCVITDAYGNKVTSARAKVIVGTPLKITAQPKNVTCKVGDTVTFTVKATGDGLKYQWQYSSDGGKTWNTSNSTTAKATCGITAARDGRLYRCIVSDKYGNSVTSSSAKISVS